MSLLPNNSTTEKIVVLVPKSIKIAFLLLMLFSINLFAEITLKYKDGEYKFNTITDNGLEYVKLSDFLVPVKIKPIYNRSIHKISFSTEKNTFVLSPISNGVYAGGDVQLFTKPTIVKKGIIYISKPCLMYIAPFMSYRITKTIIFIDPGHGGDGEDGLGAEAVLNGKKIYEKEITLNFSKHLGDILKKRGYDIKYMRENNDTKLSLKERIDKANASGASIFVSIHANSSAIDKTAKGFDVFYMSEEAEDNYSKIVAQQENKFFDKQKTDDEAGNIINSMLVSGHIKEGSKLASAISSKIPEKIMNRGVKKAPFAVLSGPTMPSVLIEIGFMSNPEDLKRINNADEMKSLASKIADGINSYLGS